MQIKVEFTAKHSYTYSSDDFDLDENNRRELLEQVTDRANQDAPELLYAALRDDVADLEVNITYVGITAGEDQGHFFDESEIIPGEVRTVSDKSVSENESGEVEKDQFELQES